MAAGGDGVVSVISNAVPRLMSGLCSAALSGKFDSARSLHLRAHSLMLAAFCESNPIPIKAALGMMGRMKNYLRLPLVQMDMKHEARLRESLVEAGALQQ
jgi:4-hydroxy-tetrahydrodipicolinate synthase